VHNYVPNVLFNKVHASGDDVWIVGTGTILLTSDGGATWTNRTPDAYKDVALQGVFVLDHDTVWVTGDSDTAGNALILKTTNAGLTWTSQGGANNESAGHLLGISAADADVAWAVGHNYSVLKTTDGGSTWTKIEQLGGKELPGLFAISFATQPIPQFNWSLFVPALTGKTRNSVD
jgi:photosystem II stability/assembly factor-like uncharacterized protein